MPIILPMRKKQFLHVLRCLCLCAVLSPVWGAEASMIPEKARHPGAFRVSTPSVDDISSPSTTLLLASISTELKADLNTTISTRSSESTPTEGGFVFYNRRMISTTFGKTRHVLLTFDDGPNPHTTPQILDILKRRDLKGIFFLVGMNVKKYPWIVKRIFDEGHTLGNHSYFHPNLTHMSQERISKEIRDTNALIMKITGIKPKVFRPPYGALNHSVLTTLQNEGMDVMLWTVDPGDWRNRNMYRTVENLKRQLWLNHGGRGGVVLLHDTLPSTAGALEPFLVALTQQGLLPTPFGTNSHNNRQYWAMRPPVNIPWHDIIVEFDFDSMQKPLLASILKGKTTEDFSSVALLRAQKSGDLMKMLLCRAF